MQILAAMLFFPACIPATPANAQEQAPPSLHCTSGRFIAFVARNAADLNESAREILNVVAQIATTDGCWNDPRVLIWIAGHRDAGEDSAVSLARAKVVRNYMLRKKLPLARMKIIDVGDTQPRRSVKDGKPERENSRVELMFEYLTEAPARDTTPQ